MIDAEEKRARMALYLMHGMGRARFQALMGVTGSARDVLSASVNQWRDWGISESLFSVMSSPDWETVDQQYAWQSQQGQQQVIWWDEPEFPPQLSAIADAPPALWVRGQISVLSDPQIALVGSRNATAGGEQTAHAFAHDLVRAGLVVTSGLAGGIDAAAHAGALDGQGATIGVMGTGVDLIYPSRNKSLAQRMLETGAIVSEFPLGTRAKTWHFPQRNRLISGLSLGVLVVEAAEASGSLITAGLALDQGREVFAIPGSIHNPLAKGCHQLIKKGQAKLTETVADMLTELSTKLHAFVAPQPYIGDHEDSYLSDDARALLSVMPYDPILIDNLLTKTKISPSNVSALLLELELSGSVNLYGGNKVARIR